MLSLPTLQKPFLFSKPIFYVALIAILAGLASGCTSTTDATLATAKNLLPSRGQAAPAALNPKFQYLRVFTSGRSALLVLGEVDDHPQGRIESWYSSQSEVIKLQNGRLFGTSGLSTNWVGVQREPTATGYRRTLDLMPGYRFGLTDEIRIRALSSPPAEIKPVAGLTAEKIKTLRWSEEAPEAASVTGRNLMGYETTADGRERAVVGYQCLDQSLCLQWERL